MTDINKQIASLDWNREPQGLYEPIAYTLQSGGKRLRPTLALLAAEMFGGKEEEVLPAALALEVFHNFTLLHDDVMDRAEVRRGRPTVHVKWGDNTAILSGDQMMIEAYRLLSEVREDKLAIVLKRFNQMATEICEGQQYDMEMERAETIPSDAEGMAAYMEMIRLKTSVLLANALQTGAYIAGASMEEQQHLYAFGIAVGLAFQIQDDLLDVYGDAKTFGKAIGGDIMCGKKTFMLITAMQQADEATREELTNLIQDSQMAAKKKIEAVTMIYDRLHVRERAEQMIGQLTEDALSHLVRLPQNDATKQLEALTQKLITRNS